MRTENVLTWQTPVFLQGRYTFIRAISQDILSAATYSYKHCSLPPYFPEKTELGFLWPWTSQEWAVQGSTLRSTGPTAWGQGKLLPEGLRSLLAQMVRSKLTGRRQEQK